MFKPGDRLKIIDNDLMPYPLNFIVTVEKIIPNTDACVVLYEDYPNDKNSGWFVHRFELVSKPYKVKRYGV